MVSHNRPVPHETRQASGNQPEACFIGELINLKNLCLWRGTVSLSHPAQLHRLPARKLAGDDWSVPRELRCRPATPCYHSGSYSPAGL